MRQVTRVTFALPRDLWETVKRTVPAGKRSSLVAAALENEIRRRQRIEQFGHLQQFQETLRKKYGELPSSAEEIERMRQEREDERES